MRTKARDNSQEIQDEIQIECSAFPEQLEEIARSPFWSTLWKFARPYRRPLLVALICSIFVGVFVPLQMQFSAKWIIDSALERSTDSGDFLEAGERLRKAMFFVGLFVILSALRISVWLAGYLRVLSSIEGTLCRIRAHFFRHVQKMCFHFHDRLSSGELFNYIMGMPINSIKQFLQQFSMNAPYQVVGLFFSIGLLASFNIYMTVVTVLVVVIIVLINYRSSLLIKEVASDYMKVESSASRYIADMLRGSRAIKTYAMEDNANTIFTSQILKMRDQGFNLAVKQKKESIKPEAVKFAGLAVVLGFGAFFVIREEMTVGTFTAFVLSFNMLMQPIILLLHLNLIRANADSGLDRIMRVLQVDRTTPEPPAGEEVDPAAQARKAGGTAEGGIKFEEVSFSYQDGPPALINFSCHIKDGEKVALVGPSGSGKTTFVSLLMRFYDPQNGRILLNGVDSRNYKTRELRNQFGVVPQDPFIFQGTLLDNIIVTNPDAGENEIRSVLDASNMTEFVEELPDGLDTWLGEGGANLSGGQKQRVAIARAMLQDSPNLIFDEATSALDNLSERRIQHAMENLMKDRTSILIAHRLTTVRNTDRIIVFDKGRMVQQGGYGELSKKPGMFRMLMESGKAG